MGPFKKAHVQIVIYESFSCVVYSKRLCMVFVRIKIQCPGLFEPITIVLKGACATVTLLFILRSMRTKSIFTLQERILQKVTFGQVRGLHSIRNMQYRPLLVRHLSQLGIQFIEISVMSG